MRISRRVCDREIDGQETLLPEDDAEWKHIIWSEVIDWIWDETNKGYKVTSKRPGFEGRYIYIPAAGFRGQDGVKGLGSDGYYWSSSLVTLSGDIWQAYSLYFHSSERFWYGSNRYVGTPIRTVTE